MQVTHLNVIYAEMVKKNIMRHVMMVIQIMEMGAVVFVQSKHHGYVMEGNQIYVKIVVMERNNK